MTLMFQPSLTYIHSRYSIIQPEDYEFFPEQDKKKEDYENDIVEDMYRWKYDGYDVLVVGEVI